MIRGRGVKMSVDVDDKEMKKKTFKDGVGGEEHGFHEDDEVKCNGVDEEVKVVGQGGSVESPSVQQHIPQQQSQGATI